MCLARNSAGENAYVADEVITARSKARVRVNNTDAEGRMVMADVLCKVCYNYRESVNNVNFTEKQVSLLHETGIVGHEYFCHVSNYQFLHFNLLTL